MTSWHPSHLDCGCHVGEGLCPEAMDLWQAYRNTQPADVNAATAALVAYKEHVYPHADPAVIASSAREMVERVALWTHLPYQPA